MDGLITRDDVVRGGACADGVYAWCKLKGITETAIPVTALIALADDEAKPYIEKVCGISGDGDGYGYGDGDGDGSG